MNKSENVERNEGFGQVCVVKGLTGVEENQQLFATTIAETFDGARVQYLETVISTDGRSNVLFAVHDEDCGKLGNNKRLEMGIFWIEDVLGNERMRNEPSVFPERVQKYITWDFGLDKITEDEKKDLLQKLIRRDIFRPRRVRRR